MLDKVKFYSWRFCKIVLNPLINTGIALLFQLTRRISTWYFFNIPGNSMSSIAFVSVLIIYIYIYIYIIFCILCTYIYIYIYIFYIFLIILKKVQLRICDSQIRYCETVCVKILHWEVARTVQKMIKNWGKVILESNFGNLVELLWHTV